MTTYLKKGKEKKEVRMQKLEGTAEEYQVGEYTVGARRHMLTEGAESLIEGEAKAMAEYHRILERLKVNGWKVERMEE